MSATHEGQPVSTAVDLFEKAKSALLKAELSTDFAAEIAGGLLAGGHVQLQSANDAHAEDIDEKVDAAIQLFDAIRSSLNNTTHRDRFAATLVQSLLASGQDALR